MSAPPPRSERIAGARAVGLGLHEALVALLERPAESEAVAIRAASPAAPVYPHAPLMADLVDRIRAELQVRIRELRPVVHEFERLERAAPRLRARGLARFRRCARASVGRRPRRARMMRRARPAKRRRRSPSARQARIRSGVGDKRRVRRLDRSRQRCGGRPHPAARRAPRYSRRLPPRRAAPLRRSPRRLGSRPAARRQPSRGSSSKGRCAGSTRAATR